MRASLFFAVTAVAASGAYAQVANTIGFGQSYNVAYIDRLGYNTVSADLLNHYDDRDNLDFLLDPADVTGTTFKLSGMRVVIQDQNASTPETFTLCGYTEDPTTPNYPDTTAQWFSVPQNLPPIPPTWTPNTGIVWTMTITMPATLPTVPKGDIWVGIGLNGGNWTTDGCAPHTVWDRVPTGTPPTVSTDLPGAGIASLSAPNLSCGVPTSAGVPSGPGVYPTGTAGSRRQLVLELLAFVAGGVAITQTNQTRYICSNPGFTAFTPLGGTTDMLSGVNPDIYDANHNPLLLPRADNIGFLVTDANLPNSPVFVMVALGASPVGSLPLAQFSPGVNDPGGPGYLGTSGNLCIDFVHGFTVFGLTSATGMFQQMVPMNAASRTLIQTLAPRDIWYQAFVVDVAHSGVTTPVHATGCAKQHL
jgi:hypothetical protein